MKYRRTLIALASLTLALVALSAMGQDEEPDDGANGPWPTIHRGFLLPFVEASPELITSFSISPVAPGESWAMEIGVDGWLEDLCDYIVWPPDVPNPCHSDPPSILKSEWYVTEPRFEYRLERAVTEPSHEEIASEIKRLHTRLDGLEQQLSRIEALLKEKE